MVKGKNTIGNSQNLVTKAVTTPSARVKLVQLTVSAANSRVFRSTTRVYTGRIHDNRQLPAAP